MSILVLNSGSSSLKAALFQVPELLPTLRIHIEGIGEDAPKMRLGDDVSDIECPDHQSAVTALFRYLGNTKNVLDKITGVGHRVIHGGENFVQPTLITDEVEREIDSLCVLAPLHNPACLAGIRAARQQLANIPHIAIFDTAFHATLPTRARLYALPESLPTPYPIRRFGFHGISHEYVAGKAAQALDCELTDLRIISCHLGNGASITAIENGRSVETSMGMTPLEGLVMGSRCGDLDPGIVIALQRESGASPQEIDALLNQRSGLLGMTGTNNMAEIETRAGDGDEACRRALHVFAHRARKYLGAYAAVMGGVDAVVFTGGIGENSAYIRHRIAQRLDFLGAVLDEDRNRTAELSAASPVLDLSAATSRVKMLLVATDEEVAMASQVRDHIRPTVMPRNLSCVPVAVSARHVHLTQETVEALFGPGHTLTTDHPLSQPGQFACKETVSLVGPRNTIEGVRVLGPTRSANQIEISRSDEFLLGVDAPVRASGDTDNTPGITLVGPAASVTLQKGVICALRHIHMHPNDARRFHVNDGDLVEAKVTGGNRDLVFSDVLIRVSEQFRLEMHIDTDEANAAGLKSHDVAVLSLAAQSEQPVSALIH